MSSPRHRLHKSLRIPRIPDIVDRYTCFNLPFFRPFIPAATIPLHLTFPTLETGCTLYIHAYVRVGPVHKVRTFHSRCKNRRVNRGKNTPAFFASLSRSCRHGIENYPPPLRPSLRALRSSLLILSCLHFRERLFLLVVDPSVRSSSFLSFFNTEIYFLLSYSHETTPHRCPIFLSFSPPNRIIDSVILFFSPSSMNLCVQRLCKKRGGQGKKRREKNIESFRRRKDWLIATRCT